MTLDVLSLFDGMGCAAIALNDLGVDVNYFSSEINKSAAFASKLNFPSQIQLGDVTKIKGRSLPPIDLLIGGSPCQGLSIVNSKGQGLKCKKSSLFFEFFRLIHETRPKYFLLENVATMKDADRDFISLVLGVPCVEINSSLVSAQNRPRYYWANFPITIPQDRGIMFKDIIDGPGRPFAWSRSRRDSTEDADGNEVKNYDERLRTDGKANALLASGNTSDSMNGVLLDPKTDLLKARRVHDKADFWPGQVLWRPLSIKEKRRLQTIPDWYNFEGVSENAASEMLGNGFTVEAIKHILKGIL